MISGVGTGRGKLCIPLEPTRDRGQAPTEIERYWAEPCGYSGEILCRCCRLLAANPCAGLSQALQWCDGVKDVRVVLADSQAEVRVALRLLLERKLGLQVVGEVDTAAELLAVLAACDPDLVLLHWRLPGIQPTELLQALHTRFPRLRIIVLSVQPEVESAALAAGADAFITKVDPPAQVVKTIAQVLANGSLPS